MSRPAAPFPALGRARTAHPSRPRRAARLLTGSLVAAVLTAGAVTPASAGPVIPNIPQTNAVDGTPRVIDDARVSEAGVRELRQIGSTMYAGGSFNSVQNAARTVTRTRTNIFSFNTTTYAMTAFAPSVNAAVYAMEPSPDGRYLYVGGGFTSFGGVSVNRLVKYDLVNNRVDTSFRFPVAAGRVSDLQLVAGRLFVAGNFPGGIVAVDPATGARWSYLDATQATGAEVGYSTRIYRFAVNPARTRMVVIGSFTAIGGRPRQQAAMITLGASAASVSGWSSTRWNEDCVDRLRFYTRDVDFSPDGGSFAIVTTGAGFPGTTKLCDTVTKWATTDSGNQQPTWINHSGGDTFHSVAYTDKAVFASGHIRWLDNPTGRDTKGPGAVDRLGIGAINPTTGRATSWNPTKSVEGGLGGFDLYLTGRGLWVGHFERTLGTGPNGRELHEGLGLLPF